MRVDLERFRTALEHRTNKRTDSSPVQPLTVVPLSDETAGFLETHGVPLPLRSFLGAHSYDQHLTMGELTFDSVNRLSEENLDELNVECIRNQLLIIGSGLNGDPLVVDLGNECLVGFVSHDELWDDEERPAPRSLLVDTGLDIGTFYLAAALNETVFPVDADAAGRLALGAWRSFRTT